MIRLNIIRYRDKVTINPLKKTENNIAKQLVKGIGSTPLSETQNFSIEIKDKPFLRFLARMSEIGEDLLAINIKATFVRSYQGKNGLETKKYVFKDQFSGDQMTLLKNGRNLVGLKGSFLNKLVNNINKSITE